VTLTGTPSTTKGISLVWMRSPRAYPVGGSVLIQWARWSCHA
jgi:hypothetical protein